MKCQPKFASWVLAGAAVALLGGCSSEQDNATTEPERSVEWYQEHRAERDAKAIECATKSDALAAADGNCARARLALLLIKPSK